MKNFRDVLQQRHLNYEPLLCNEGVYLIVQDLQLLNPSLFENIFLGRGGFHMEKKPKYPVVAVTSKSVELEVCLLRIRYLVQELFSQFCLESTTYVAKKGIMMLAETSLQLQFQEYLRSNPDHLQDSQHIEAFQNTLTNAAPNESTDWRYHEVKMKGLIHSIGDFNNAGCQKSNQFKFWYVFL